MASTSNDAVSHDSSLASPATEEVDYSFDQSPARYFNSSIGLQLGREDEDQDDEVEQLRLEDDSTVPSSPGVHSISLESPVVTTSSRYIGAVGRSHSSSPFGSNQFDKQRKLARGVAAGFDSLTETDDDDDQGLSTETEDEKPPSLPPKPSFKRLTTVTNSNKPSSVDVPTVSVTAAATDSTSTTTTTDKKPVTSWREWLTGGFIGVSTPSINEPASSVTSTPAISDVESSPGAQGPFPYEFLSDPIAFSPNKSTQTPSMQVLVGNVEDDNDDHDDKCESGQRSKMDQYKSVSPPPPVPSHSNVPSPISRRKKSLTVKKRPEHLITIVPSALVAEGSPYLKMYLSRPISRRGVLLPLRKTLSEQVSTIAQEYGISSPEDIALYLLSAAESVKSRVVVPLENGPKISAEAWTSLWADLFPEEDELRVEDKNDKLFGEEPYGQAESDRMNQTAPSPRRGRISSDNRNMTSMSPVSARSGGKLQRSRSSPSPASPRISDDWSVRSPTPTALYGVDLVVGRLEFDIEPRGLFGVGFGDVHNALAPFTTPAVPRHGSMSATNGSAWAKRRGSKWTIKSRSENDTESIGTTMTPQFSTPAWSTPGGAKSSTSSLSNRRFSDTQHGDDPPLPALPSVRTMSSSSIDNISRQRQDESSRSSVATVSSEASLPVHTHLAPATSSSNGPILFSRFSSSSSFAPTASSDTTSPQIVRSPSHDLRSRTAAPEVVDDHERRPSVSLASFLGNVSSPEDATSRATPSLSSVAEESDEIQPNIGLGVFGSKIENQEQTQSKIKSKSTPQKLAELSKALGLASPDPATVLNGVEDDDRDRGSEGDDEDEDELNRKTPSQTPSPTKHNPTFFSFDRSALSGSDGVIMPGTPPVHDHLSVINEVPETPQGSVLSRDAQKTPVRASTTTTTTTQVDQPSTEWQPFVPGFDRYQIKPSRPAPQPPAHTDELGHVEDPVVALRNSMVAPSDRGSFSGSSSTTGRRPSDDKPTQTQHHPHGVNGTAGMSNMISHAIGGLFRTKSSADVTHVTDSYDGVRSRSSIGSDNGAGRVSPTQHRRKQSGSSFKSFKLKTSTQDNHQVVSNVSSTTNGNDRSSSPPLPNCSPTLPTSKTFSTWIKNATSTHHSIKSSNVSSSPGVTSSTAPPPLKPRHTRTDSRSSSRSNSVVNNIPAVPPVPARHASYVGADDSLVPSGLVQSARSSKSSHYDSPKGVEAFVNDDSESVYDDVNVNKGQLEQDEDDEEDVLEVTLNRARTTSLIPTNVKHHSTTTLFKNEFTRTRSNSRGTNDKKGTLPIKVGFKKISTKGGHDDQTMKRDLDDGVLKVNTLSRDRTSSIPQQQQPGQLPSPQFSIKRKELPKDVLRAMI
ncbi:hypothetical protein OIO90_006457 [Microbotryomycetes sp. JL221]|nr:hypothetical protein OIO90_006457 [Microbotryomycetes sp. JL221]